MPRQREGTVPIFSCSGSNRIIRRVSRAEAVRLVEGGTMSMITSGRGKATELVALKMTELEKLSKSDAATIKMSEVIANAGGYGKSKTVNIPDSRKEAEDIEPDFVERALAKIRAWPTASRNNRAVTVVPRAAFA
jgi:hypothetical protein